jgi:hypothetical protein
MHTHERKEDGKLEERKKEKSWMDGPTFHVDDPTFNVP